MFNDFITELSQKTLRLRIYPDPVLREIANPVGKFDKRLLNFSEQMLDFMKRYKGIGLAAPQVGYLYRVITIDIEGTEKCLVNPEILSSSSDSNTATEGCLSLPEKWYDVNRQFQVEIRARNPNGKTFHVEAKGLHARVLQHEIDHLNGILIRDKGTEIENNRS
jgi:peptide deformylase